MHEVNHLLHKFLTEALRGVQTQHNTSSCLDVVDEASAERRVSVLVSQGFRRALLNQLHRVRVWVC